MKRVKTGSWQQLNACRSLHEVYKQEKNEQLSQWVIFQNLWSSVQPFKIHFLKQRTQNIQEHYQCQTFWIQIWPNVLSGCLKISAAEDLIATGRQFLNMPIHVFFVQKNMSAHCICFICSSALQSRYYRGKDCPNVAVIDYLYRIPKNIGRWKSVDQICDGWEWVLKGFFHI